MLPKWELDLELAMDHNLWLHFGADEHPCITYSDVHQPGIQGFDPQPVEKSEA